MAETNAARATARAAVVIDAGNAPLILSSQAVVHMLRFAAVYIALLEAERVKQAEHIDLLEALVESYEINAEDHET